MNCLQKWLKESGKCPLKCEDPDFKMKPHKIIRNMLSKLQLKCRNEANGCSEIIDYEKLEVHEEVECQFEVYDCPESEFGCTAKMKKFEIEKHLREKCVYAKIECMYCQKMYLKKDIRDHLMACDSAMQTCPHCKGQFLKKNFQIHVSAQCEENYINCGRCQANYKRKYKDFHDCVRHLQN
jgi:hypothetical protein